MKKIIYPKVSNINKMKIGVTAPSSGLGKDVFIKRFELIKKQFEEKGIEIIEGECLRKNEKYVSGKKEKRAEDFLSLWKREDIDFIFPPWGGENLIDLLELIDFEKLKMRPTWIQGYSDISTLLFSITVRTGIATAHGTNLLDSIEGQDPLTEKSRDYLGIKEGGSLQQESGHYWQKNFTNFSDNLEARFNLTEKTLWKTLFDEEEIKFKGRIIGGCLDTIVNLIGSPYGDLPRFYRDYCQEDGLILFLENCELSPPEVYRSLWNMKYAGWFDNIKGVIFGRSAGPDNTYFSYKDSLRDFFSGSSFPVLYDADIGHKPPQLTIINGSLAEICYRNGRGSLIQLFD